MAEAEATWSKEWPRVNGQYWIRVPADHDFDEVVEIEGNLAWMQGQIDPCSAGTLVDYEFLGPVTAETANERDSLREALEGLLAGLPTFPDLPDGPDDDLCIRPESIKLLRVGAIRRARATLGRKGERRWPHC